MTEYADIKKNKFQNFLKKLKNISGIEVSGGGRHNTKVTCIHTGQSYPIPSSHPVITKFIVKDFMKWLVRSNICTKEDFDKMLG